jgi:hypothetical protein
VTVEQITKERKRDACRGCGREVTHVQVVEFVGPQRFKSYRWVPVAHRRGDGAPCSHLADLRNELWTRHAQC